MAKVEDMGTERTYISLQASGVWAEERNQDTPPHSRRSFCQQHLNAMSIYADFWREQRERESQKENGCGSDSFCQRRKTDISL